MTNEARISLWDTPFWMLPVVLVTISAGVTVAFVAAAVFLYAAISLIARAVLGV